MSAKLRAKLWSEINTNWARSKGMSGSRGGAYFNQGEVRIVKTQFDNKMRKICLLYTSPSPRDGLLPRMPSSA